MTENLYLKDELYDLVKRDDSIFEFLQSGSLDGVWYWDMEKPDNEWLSPEFKALFGYEDHEVPNTAEWWQKNISPEDLPAVLERFEAHLKDPSVPYDQIVSYKHKNGSKVWVRCRGMAIRDEEGKPIRMLGCHTDVTSLKIAEQKLEESLDKVNLELDNFSIILSHDLKEPLRKIQIFSDFMNEAIDENNQDDLRMYAQQIHSASKRISTLMDAMLRYSKLSKKDVDFHEVYINDVLQYVRDDLYERIMSEHAEITLKGIETLPAIEAEPSFMYQLFLNLLTNALKYHRPDEPPKITITGESNETHVTIIVTDQGIGIEKKFLDVIFDPFKRLHRREEYEGTGVGLTSCRKIIALHHGKMEVESTFGEGSTFKVSLPLVQSDSLE